MTNPGIQDVCTLRPIKRMFLFLFLFLFLCLSLRLVFSVCLSVSSICLCRIIWTKHFVILILSSDLFAGLNLGKVLTWLIGSGGPLKMLCQQGLNTDWTLCFHPQLLCPLSQRVCHQEVNAPVYTRPGHGHLLCYVPRKHGNEMKKYLHVLKLRRKDRNKKEKNE